MSWWTDRPQMRGVNLGGWLLLEEWMQRGLFAGTGAADEYELCLAWGDSAAPRLREHRETYISRDDLEWIAAHGLNAVRIPFSYWLLEGDPPFIAGAEILDEALKTCDKLGLMVVLDLHGIVGGQSRQHHTGRRNHFQWPNDQNHRRRNLDVIGALAQRYAGFNCVRGLSLVNEPDVGIPASILNDFYREAYRRVRQFMSYEKVAVIISAFTEHRLPHFHATLRSPQFENVITDVHYYQCFGDWYEHLSLDQQLNFPITHRQPELRNAMERGWIMVGEWSLRLPWHPRDLVRELQPADQDRVWRAFGETQIRVYGETQGWFFWSYKAENQPEWSFRDCVERGWLPDSFVGR